MTRYKATSKGNIPYTAQEELEADARDAASSATAKTRHNEQIKLQRAAIYSAEADGLFFKTQRGDATLQEWQAKITEIKTRLPYLE